MARKRAFSWAPGEPPWLTVEWDYGYTDARVVVDGKLVDAVKTKAELVAGRHVRLADGREVEIRLARPRLAPEVLATCESRSLPAEATHATMPSLPLGEVAPPKVALHATTPKLSFGKVPTDLATDAALQLAILAIMLVESGAPTGWAAYAMGTVAVVALVWWWRDRTRSTSDS